MTTSRLTDEQIAEVARIVSATDPRSRNEIERDAIASALPALLSEVRERREGEPVRTRCREIADRLEEAMRGPGVLVVPLREAIRDLRSMAPAPKRPPPTHRCKVCGALWRLNPADPQRHPPPHPFSRETWSLWSRACGPCCDNAAMGEQLEPITDFRPLCDPGPWDPPAPAPDAAREDGDWSHRCPECGGPSRACVPYGAALYSIHRRTAWGRTRYRGDGT